MSAGLDVHGFTVVSNEPAADGLMRIVLRAPALAAALAPGQFVNIHVPGDASQILRIPLSFSCADAAAGTVSLCGFVTLFYVLAKPLSSLGGHLAPALVGLVELFSLTPLLPPDHLGFVLAAGCSGWGGLSVLAQTAAALEGTGLPLEPCVKGKALQGLLSAAMAAALAGYALG